MKNSSVQDDTSRCFLCGREGYLHEHHVMNGKGWRRLSDEDRLVVYLCPKCHDYIHSNADARKFLKAQAEMVYLETHTFNEWMKRYGKNYIETIN